MGLLDSIRNELVDLIEWIDDRHEALVWRFPRHQNEIKNGAQLIVRPGQQAIFVHRGEIADVFEPGNYELKTDNIPVLSKLMAWKHGFNSPFRAEVYFVNTTQVTDLKWGTPNPIMMRDPDFGPIRLRAFGTYTLKAIDPRALLNELVGADKEYHSGELNELLRSIIVTSFTDMLGEAKIAALDLAAQYEEMSDELRKRVCERIDDEYGLDVPRMMIVNISLPKEVEEALDTRTKMGVLGDMAQYQQYQMANAITAAANNPGAGGGMAATGMGLGMGMAMAGQMAGAMQGAMAPGAAAPAGQPVGQPQAAPGMGGPPPPPPPSPVWHISVQGKTQGPFSFEQLVQGIGQGQLNAQTMVWSAGLSGWLPAGQVQQLASYFASPPPPPPPPPPPEG